MESLWEIHIRITASCIEIRYWNLACCLILPSTWSRRRCFRIQGSPRGLVAPTSNFVSPSLSRKLIELGSWNLAHSQALYKKMLPLGVSGRSTAPNFFYFDTLSIYPKLIELGSWNLDLLRRHSPRYAYASLGNKCGASWYSGEYNWQLYLAYHWLCSSITSCPRIYKDV